MSTKPEQHDVVRAFAKSLKPPFRLSLPALETLAVIAYKQPVTVPEISEIRGVDSERSHCHVARSQAHYDGGQKSRHRPSHPLQDQQRVSAPLRAQGRSANCPAWKNSRSCWPNHSRATCFPVQARLEKDLSNSRTGERFLRQHRRSIGSRR